MKGLKYLLIPLVAVYTFFTITTTSCSMLQPRIIYQKDSIYITKKDSIHLRDSVWLKDSVIVYKQADTVYITKVKYEYKYKDFYKFKIDTIYMQHTDSVFVMKYKEKELSKMQKFQLSFAKIAGGVLLALLIFFGIKLYRKFF